MTDSSATESNDMLRTALKQILEEVTQVKVTAGASNRLATDLQAIVQKVDDHDRSIMLVAKAIEDMNKNAAAFTETLKDIQKENTGVQRDSHKIMLKLEQVLENMAKTEPRLGKIEEKQSTGCSSFLNFVKQRDAELKHWEDVKTTLLTATSRNRDEIHELHNKSEVNAEKIRVVNERVKDLELGHELVVTAIATSTKDFNAWKETMYKGLIANAVLLVITVAGAIIGLVK